jgi:hypothetical protein
MTALLRRSLALLVALALVLPTLAPTAAEAKGRNRDLFNFLAGATTAVILLKALEAPPVHAAPPPVYYQHPYPYAPPPPPRPAHLYLPAHCARDYPVPGAHDVVYLDGCLRNAGYHWALPAGCGCDVLTDRGWRRAWSGRCLSGAGYVVTVRW